MSVAEVMRRSDEGLPKLWTIHRALQLRNKHPEWFGRSAAYKPLRAHGLQADRVIAYLRGSDVVTVAQRWALSVASWEDTAINLPRGAWHNHLTDERIDNDAHGGECKMNELFAKVSCCIIDSNGLMPDATDEGQVSMYRFGVWAPRAMKMTLQWSGRRMPMEGPTNVAGGLLRCSEAHFGDDYWFLIDDAPRRCILTRVVCASPTVYMALPASTITPLSSGTTSSGAVYERRAP